MLVKGVLNSWLMFATKRLFAKFASSARTVWIAKSAVLSWTKLANCSACSVIRLWDIALDKATAAICANSSKIFGELLYLLEYRDKEIKLTYSSDKYFKIPENLYLIGTMNTADRSLAMIDYALRRRFYFITLETKYEQENF